MKWRVVVGILFIAAIVIMVSPPAFAPITVGTGVAFQPGGSWANITFASIQTFSIITLTTNAVTFNSTTFGVEKLPASLPRVENNINLWNPSAGMGSIALEWNGTANSGSNVWWNLSGLVSNAVYRILVDDSPYVNLIIADGEGAIRFNYSAWTSTHKFTILRLVSGAPQNLSVAWCIPGPCALAVITVTGSPVNITRESAILRGNLLSMGDNSEVNVSFEWGINESLGFPTDIQIQDATGQFEQLILGLVPDAVYYFRAKAVGSEGTAYGAILNFRTVAIVPVELITDITILIAGIIVFIIAILVGFWIQQAPVLLIGGLIGTLLGLWFIFTFTEIFVGLSFIALGILFAYIGWVNIEGIGD